MKKYKITYGSGLAWVNEEIVEVEDFENEQDVVDKLIDNLETEGCEVYFISQEEIDEGAYFEDEYVIGGKHGRYLFHGGMLYIKSA